MTHTTGAGYSGRVFFNGEEVDSRQEGRVFAHMMDGTSYELPALGKASWENILAHSDTGLRTVVVGLDDSSGIVAGQVYIYVGEKNVGEPVEAAGLSNGKLFGVKVQGSHRNRSTGIPDDPPFPPLSFGDASNMTGAAIESASAFNGVTAFLRPEDGAVDPSSRNDSTS